MSVSFRVDVPHCVLYFRHTKVHQGLIDSGSACLRLGPLQPIVNELHVFSTVETLSFFVTQTWPIKNRFGEM